MDSRDSEGVPFASDGDEPAPSRPVFVAVRKDSIF